MVVTISTVVVVVAIDASVGAQIQQRAARCEGNDIRTYVGT